MKYTYCAQTRVGCKHGISNIANSHRMYGKSQSHVMCQQYYSLPKPKNRKYGYVLLTKVGTQRVWHIILTV